MKRQPKIVTKPSAASARARLSKDILRRDHRRGEHENAPTIKCPDCRSAGHGS